MKQRLLLLVLFFVVVPVAQSQSIDPMSGDPVKINPTKPPEGMNIIQILLENQSLSLEGTGCDSASENKRTLQHLLAITLGEGLGNNANKRHQTIISGGCKTEQFELRSGSIIDGWRCNLNVEEKTIKKGEYIASSNIAFGVRKNTWELITDSITPNPLICMP